MSQLGNSQEKIDTIIKSKKGFGHPSFGRNAGLVPCQRTPDPGRDTDTVRRNGRDADGHFK